MKAKNKVVYVPPVYEEVQHEVTSVDDNNVPLRTSFHTDISLKSARDYYEGGFCGTYSTWVTGYDQSFLSAWRRNRGTFNVPDYDSIEDLFKCRASLLYPIFVNQWSGTVNDDKLLIGSVNTCVAVRPFSLYGLPYSK